MEAMMKLSEEISIINLDGRLNKKKLSNILPKVKQLETVMQELIDELEWIYVVTDAYVFTDKINIRCFHVILALRKARELLS
jgi:hypothetical protein